MIDFQNKVVFKLRQTTNDSYMSILTPLMTDDEKIISTYQALRDGLVFSDKRIFSINVQGVTGKKKDITSLPYSKIQSFSVETAGVLDLDSELELYFSGLGKVKFEFTGSSNIAEIGKIISSYVLK